MNPHQGGLRHRCQARVQRSKYELAGAEEGRKGLNILFVIADRGEERDLGGGREPTVRVDLCLPGKGLQPPHAKTGKGREQIRREDGGRGRRPCFS